MSKQLTLSAALSVLAMTAFALFAARSPEPAAAAATQASTSVPAMEQPIAALPLLDG